MLNENIRAVRKSKGLSQEALAIRLNVVRQTISKWEKGLSVPDADLLIALSEALETPVSALLGETMAEPEEDGLRAICEKLEEINLRFAREKARRRKALHWILIALCAAIATVFAALAALLPVPVEGGSTVYRALYTVVNWLALNVGNAKNASSAKTDQ